MRVKRREIQTLHCSKWFSFYNAYLAQQCQIFRIFANSANKRQTTVIINQILTQKWLLLQNFISSEDSSYFRNRVFNNGE
jgi:hypothetical protein